MSCSTRPRCTSLTSRPTAGQAFVDTNITGTLRLLEAASNVRAFVFTSTTSTFGDALAPPIASPAAWITEAVVPAPKNIYGVTKVAAEDLCALAHRNQQLACLVLRTSRFFNEADDSADARTSYADANLKVSEFLYRRVDVEDVVAAHLLAIDRAPAIGFGRYIIAATTPFARGDAAELRRDPATVLSRCVPGWRDAYHALGWKMLPSLDRVYDNTHARTELGWQPPPRLRERARTRGDRRDSQRARAGDRREGLSPCLPMTTPHLRTACAGAARSSAS